MSIPLAEQLRPKDLDEFVGQEHLVGKEGALRKLIETGSIQSMIFWGPPGSGKTTLARLISKYTNAHFVNFSAVTGKVAEVRDIIKAAKQRKLMISENRELFKQNEKDEPKSDQTILFVDEIHRFNKAQQDAFLPFVEDGTIILIGATTENPGFEINAPLVSRSQIYIFKKINDKDIEKIITRACKTLDIKVDKPAKEFIVSYSNGDARKTLNTIELLSRTNKKAFKLKDVENILQHKALGYDKKGDNHYDTISAFIKSMRGSKPDATLHYLARMLQAGEDPVFIARRMLIFASEDIGNAKPNALVLATSTMQAVKMIGLPEAKIILAQCATYLATCPKSIASYHGLGLAAKDIREYSLDPIPLHLRNASNTVMKKAGYAKGHERYPWLEAKKGKKIEQEYMPDNLKGRKYYDFEGLSE